MSRSMPASVVATCPSCAQQDFAVRAIADEGLATLQCVACEQNFLLLDSDDYWFDVIQKGYPRLRKCACKSTSFRLRCDYHYRDSGDVRSVDVRTFCSDCAKEKRLLGMDIKYGGTDQLVSQPLKHCANPKILYDLQELTLYATGNDMAKVIEFLATHCACSFVCWSRHKDKWKLTEQSGPETSRIVRQTESQLSPPAYQRIYAQQAPIKVPDDSIDQSKREASFWKRHEVIRFSSPLHIAIGNAMSSKAPALLFYINFSNEYVDGETIVRKSNEFVKMTNDLLDWLTAEFVTWRGPRCFDNRDEHLRIFGNKYTKRK